MLTGAMSTSGATPQQGAMYGGGQSPMSSEFSGDGVFEPEFELTPLIKEELRSTIRNRRINSGKSDDLSYDDGPKPQYKLTAEEEHKRELRRDRNRVAAAKCRIKRKNEVCGLTMESERLQLTNERLREEIQKLKDEKRVILELINSHRPSCIVPPINVPDVQTAQAPSSSYNSVR